MSSNSKDEATKVIGSATILGLGCFGIVLFIVFSITYTSILSAFTLTLLWEWFLVDPFGLPPITIPLAIGISLIVSMLVKDYDLDKERKEREWYSSLLILFLLPLARYGLVLLIGWIAAQFL